MSEALKNFTAFRNTLLDTSAEFCDTISEDRVSAEDRYYTCKVYDVEHNAEIGDHPAYSQEKIPIISPQNTTCTCTYTGMNVHSDSVMLFFKIILKKKKIIIATIVNRMYNVSPVDL